MQCTQFDAVFMCMQLSPLSLFWIEGCGQIPYAMNWGDGFVVDDSIIKEHGITDPKPFFDAVLAKPYRDLVVLSPHYYPPSISLQHNKQVPSSPPCSSLDFSVYSLWLESLHHCREFDVHS